MDVDNVKNTVKRRLSGIRYSPRGGVCHLSAPPALNGLRTATICALACFTQRSFAVLLAGNITLLAPSQKVTCEKRKGRHISLESATVIPNAAITCAAPFERTTRLHGRGVHTLYA